ncbi:hypothetical protein [Polycladidibacter hongkongensis]|uniref:hypothetical protein n=1 Tax=Polycladidibacter hongkongensis TaxID=1647556 RepID=UPI000830F71D|nr:hypothetical protein [Pseudovibrio hongkongensis]
MSDENTNEDAMVFIIVGRVWEEDKLGQDDAIVVNLLVRAADEDDAVRQGLEALAEDSYAEAEFERIGVLDEAPSEKPFDAAYADALQGVVAVIAFNE